MSTYSGPSQASGAAEHLQVADESVLQQRRLGSHCGDPTNTEPDGAARDPVIRRQYITQRWVVEHGVTPGCPQ